MKTKYILIGRERYFQMSRGGAGLWEPRVLGIYDTYQEAYSQFRKKVVEIFNNARDEDQLGWWMSEEMSDNGVPEEQLFATHKYNYYGKGEELGWVYYERDDDDVLTCWSLESRYDEEDIDSLAMIMPCCYIQRVEIED